MLQWKLIQVYASLFSKVLQTID